MTIAGKFDPFILSIVCKILLDDLRGGYIACAEGDYPSVAEKFVWCEDDLDGCHDLFT